MSTRVSRFLTLGFVFSIALVLIFSPLTYAVDGSLNITSIRYANYHPIQVAYCTEQSAQGETVYGNCGNKYWVSDASGGLSFAQNIHTSFSGVRFETPSDSNFKLQYNDIISMDFDVYQASANNSLDTTVISVRSISSGFQVIDQQYQQLDNTSGKIKLLIWCSKTEGYSAGAHDIVMVAAKAPANDLYSWNLGWLRETNAYINPGVVNVFHFQSPSSSSGSSFDDTDVLNSISDVKSSIDRQVQAQEQANDDANDRYEDEKDTINDSRDEAESTASTMDTSGFNITNPFTNFFALFTDNQCVSIPTIQGWLHGTESQVCSPWRGNNVRSILTPVFSILSTLIITGFVMRWLSSGNKEGTIEGI